MSQPRMSFVGFNRAHIRLSHARRALRHPSLAPLVLITAMALTFALRPIDAQATGPDPVVGAAVALLDAADGELDTDTTDSNGDWGFTGNTKGVKVNIVLPSLADSNFYGTLADDTTALPGVSVSLLDSFNNVLDTDTTDSNGEYTLDAGTGTADQVVVDWGTGGEGPTKPTGSLTSD